MWCYDVFGQTLVDFNLNVCRESAFLCPPFLILKRDEIHNNFFIWIFSSGFRIFLRETRCGGNMQRVRVWEESLLMFCCQMEHAEEFIYV